MANPRPNLQDPPAAGDHGLDVLFQVDPLLLHSIDEAGTLLNVSTAWARLLGYARDELIGRRIVDLMTPASRAYALSRGLAQFYTQGQVTNLPYEFQRADGRPIPVLLSSGAIRDKAGRFLHSFAVLTDDRRARYAERALDARDQRDAGGEGALHARLERLAHETRTPLGAILGFAGLMEQGELDRSQKERLAQVLAAAETLRQVLDAALAEVDSGLTPRRHSGTFPPDPAPAEAAEHLALAPMRVLLAIADATRQDSLREMLRAGGHEVIAVANGYEAIEALFAGPLDLAIIALDMPGLSGRATVSQIRNSGRDFRDIPIVACAGNDDTALAALRGQGMDGVLPRPCTPGTLEAELRRALDARAQPR